jgi:hypothetical protein
MSLRLVLVVTVSACCLGSTDRAAAQQGPPPAFEDALLDDLVGTWSMEGQVRGDSVTYRATAEWVLGHQFLRIQMRDVTSTPAQYSAHVYVGYDPETEEYVAHWLDDTGGRASKTLGTGSRTGNALRLLFEYPDAPFRTVFERQSPIRWEVRMRAKGDDGTWQPFADYVLTPRSP